MHRYVVVQDALREDAELLAESKSLEQEVDTRRLGCSDRMMHRL
jgi:hypothetical protein